MVDYIKAYYALLVIVCLKFSTFKDKLLQTTRSSGY